MTSYEDGRWHPGIGDPDATGWITVAAYAGAFVLCFMCQRKVPPGPSRQFWMFMTFAMGTLGLNKQLDLQSWFTEVGRDLSLEYGWYAYRRIVQATFIGGLIVAGIVGYSILLRILRGLDSHARAAALGLMVLGLFILVRAASFHHVDVLLGITIENIRLNVVLELSGIFIIAFGAWGCWRSSTFKR